MHSSNCRLGGMVTADTGHPATEKVLALHAPALKVATHVQVQVQDIFGALHML